MIFWRTLPMVVLFALMLQGANAFAPIDDQSTREIFQLYVRGEYYAAKARLIRFMEQDTAAFGILRYFMLADIYTREQKFDSALQVVNLAWDRTNKSGNLLLIKRNGEFIDSLKSQLSFERKYLRIPKLKPLESYEMAREDSGVSDSAAVEVMDAESAEMDSSKSLLEVGILGRDPQLPKMSGNQPVLIGGLQAIERYIVENEVFPDSALKAGIEQAMVFAEVTVDTFGNPIDIAIIQAAPENMGFEESAREVLMNMQYRPAETDSGKIVSRLAQPVRFNLAEVGK